MVLALVFAAAIVLAAGAGLLIRGAAQRADAGTVAQGAVRRAFEGQEPPGSSVAGEVFAYAAGKQESEITPRRRAFGIVRLAVLLLVSGAVVAAGLYELGHALNHLLSSYVQAK